MTPSQLIQRTPAAEEPAAWETPEPPVESTEIDFTPCVAGVHYTSEAMEEDFSTSVELLMGTTTFLRFLQDADRHMNILGEKSAQQLATHIDTIEEFTGQWQND